MWLHPRLPALARMAARTFYRFQVAGPMPPDTGPVLLVANHPNSLVDPIFVAAAAGRPVRFLAKAPLFDQPSIGWLVKAAGCIPVYRRVDDPNQVGRNTDMFRAAEQGLTEGGAVAIFPEGVSHSESTLQPLKTGAARIALGAARAMDGPVAIVPVGLVLRERYRFRSSALALLGPAIDWHDLAHHGPEDQTAVHALTERIDHGLRAVTINVERWEDEPLVRVAEAAWTAERWADVEDSTRIPRLGRAATLLARLRETADRDWPETARRVRDHGRKLALLGLEPGDLHAGLGWGTALLWIVGRAHFLILAVVWAVGCALFWLPYRLTGWWEGRQGLAEDVRATYRLIGGTVSMALWLVAVAAAAGVAAGIWAALGSLLLLPVLGALTLWLEDRRQAAWRDARRFFLLRGRRRLRQYLAADQAELAADLDRLYAAHVPAAGSPEPSVGRGGPFTLTGVGRSGRGTGPGPSVAAGGGDRFIEGARPPSQAKDAPVNEEAAQAAKASYARCGPSDKFFSAFYDRFFTNCPPARALFAQTDFPRQHKLLQHAIGSLLIFDRQPDGEPNLLTRVAARHSRADLGVEPTWYPLFLESLIETVRDHDPEYSPAVEGAWRNATAKGIAYMQSKY